MHAREMAVGNTFGATALSSYGGFWIAIGIILTPGGFEIGTAYGGIESAEWSNAFGFFLFVRPQDPRSVSQPWPPKSLSQRRAKSQDQSSLVTPVNSI